ncbi:MAG: MotA/TolQ/ExbB proton channel family protein [Deltaproteobacteria bacterium]|nr:MAG: MotA/TolQ/ExbB proton channel family protein [Deltaproteobacteria bacterium]
MASLRSIVAQSHKLIRRFARVNRRKGTFYDRSGMQVQGTQIWFGRIAALGSHSSGGGVLQAAPGNSFRIAPTEQSLSKDAKTWAERSGNYLVPTLLFDPLQKKRSQPKEKTWSQTVEEGGPIGVLILVLAGLGVLLLVERGVTLLWMTNWRRAQWSLLLQQARDKHWSAARALTVGMGANTPVLKSIMENPDSSREDMQEVASESILRVLPTFQRSFTLLNVIITVAPLLGLLGTVTGMIATFEVITQFGTGNPKLLSQGISEALITTKLGLAVAVPLLLAKSVLSRWADRVLEALQLRAMILINQIHQPNSQPQSTSDTTEQQGQDGAV